MFLQAIDTDCILIEEKNLQLKFCEVIACNPKAPIHSDTKSTPIIKNYILCDIINFQEKFSLLLCLTLNLLDRLHLSLKLTFGEYLLEKCKLSVKKITLLQC
jgi:hypothetical protein